MYVVLERPDRPPLRVKIEGGKALVGRAPHCDLVIEEEFVSKQHLTLLHGVVAIDQSTNGSFVDGVRIGTPTVIGDKRINIAQTDITVHVELPPQGPAAESDAAAALRAEVASLQGRVRELETTPPAAAADAALRHENDTLRARVAELERQAAAVTPAPEKPAPEKPAPEKPVDDSPVSMLIFKLQRENAELKRALAQQGAAAKPAPVVPPTAGLPPAALPPGPTPVAKPGKPSVMGAFPAFAKLQKDKAPASDTSPPVERPAERPPERAASRPMAAIGRLEELVKVDAEELPTRTDDALDAFLMAEGYRFLRRVEKVVSRVSSGLIQLYQAQTLVPGVEGTLRDFLRSAIADPDRAMVREGFLAYLKELGRWMVASLLSYRQAAEKFVAQLRADLAPEALLPEEAGPGKKLSAKTEAELWRRVVAYVRELNTDRIRERIERLARDAAEDVVGKDGAQAFG